MITKDPSLIPDLHIGRAYNLRDEECDVHYGPLEDLVTYFGNNKPMHRHVGFYQVHLVTDGCLSLQLDGRVHYGPAPLVFLTPPAIPHAFYAEDGTRGHVITVRQDLIRTLFASMPGQWGEPYPRTCQFLLLRDLTPEQAELATRLATLAEDLGREYNSRTAGKAVALNALCHVFFIVLTRLFSTGPGKQAESADGGDDLSIFLSFCDLVEDHYTDHLRLPDYCRRLGVTEARLNDICRRMAHMASKELVHNRVLQEARSLLRFSSMPVSEIAYQLGFSDPAYFSRFFSRLQGEAPRPFRSRTQVGHMLEKAERGKVQIVFPNVHSKDG